MKPSTNFHPSRARCASVAHQPSAWTAILAAHEKGPHERTRNQRQPIKHQTQNPPALRIIAELSESEIIPVFVQMCRDRAIPISQPSPNLAEILEAVDKHLQAHRSRPIIDFPGGDQAWRLAKNDLTSLRSSIEKILVRKLSAPFTSASERRSEQTAESEYLASEQPGARSCERSPSATSAHTAHSPSADRSFNGQQTLAGNRPGALVEEDFDEEDDDQLDEDELDDDDDLEDDAEQIQNARAEYLGQLLRERTSRSPLDDLSPECQKTLFELLQDHAHTLVAEMVSQPKPLGWGLQTSRHSLKRFCNRYRKQHRETELAEAANEAQKLVQNPSATPQNFAEATRRLIQSRLFEMAKDPHCDTDAMEFVSRYLDRQRKADLSERRIQLAEQKSTDTQ